MIKIYQNKQLDLFQTKKTVDWLVENTIVSVFNPINFKGYQRNIDNKHCMKIVEFLKLDFFMPTAIICATDNEFRVDGTLRIVDGQHRVNAFKLLRSQDPERYEQIKNYEIPVIVMAKVDENTEIDTFITINKTSKKVDTSLALVLKNKMNKYNNSEDLTMPKAEYIAVEVAQRLNYNDAIDNIWFDKILFEGTPKNTPQLISLNAFVKSTRVLFNQMAKKQIISLGWTTHEEIDICIEKCCEIMLSVWSIVQNKWPDLFDSDLEKRRIIQGAIGFTSINKVITELLSKIPFVDENHFIYEFKKRMQYIPVESDNWLPGNVYSKYSSESGYRIIAKELLSAIEI